MLIDIENRQVLTNSRIAVAENVTNLEVSSKTLSKLFSTLKEARSYATDIIRYSNDSIIKGTIILEQFATNGFISPSKFQRLESEIAKLSIDDKKLSNTLYNLVSMFYKYVETVCQNSCPEAMENTLKQLINEATTLKNTIEKIKNHFLKIYEDIIAKLKTLSKTDQTSFLKKINTGLNKLDKRLEVYIDEALYYKILHAFESQ